MIELDEFEIPAEDRGKLRSKRDPVNGERRNIMKSDMVEIIGVYWLENEDIKNCDELLNPENAENAVIVEMIIKRPLREFDIGEITQADDSLPRNCWQSVYDEVFLNEAGTEIIDEKEILNAGHETVRFVFFFHFLDLDKPLHTPFGDIPLKKPTQMPKRLKGKIAYWEP